MLKRGKGGAYFCFESTTFYVLTEVCLCSNIYADLRKLFAARSTDIAIECMKMFDCRKISDVVVNLN